MEGELSTGRWKVKVKHLHIGGDDYGVIHAKKTVAEAKDLADLQVRHDVVGRDRKFRAEDPTRWALCVRRRKIGRERPMTP